MSRLDIADYLGLTVETVSRVLGDLEAANIIARPTARHVVLCDRDKLRLPRDVPQDRYRTGKPTSQHSPTTLSAAVLDARPYTRHGHGPTITCSSTKVGWRVASSAPAYA